MPTREHCTWFGSSLSCLCPSFSLAITAGVLPPFPSFLSLVEVTSYLHSIRKTPNISATFLLGEPQWRSAIRKSGRESPLGSKCRERVTLFARGWARREHVIPCWPMRWKRTPPAALRGEDVGRSARSPRPAPCCAGGWCRRPHAWSDDRAGGPRPPGRRLEGRREPGCPRRPCGAAGSTGGAATAGLLEDTGSVYAANRGV